MVGVGNVATLSLSKCWGFLVLMLLQCLIPQVKGYVIYILLIQEYECFMGVIIQALFVEIFEEKEIARYF